MSADLVGQLKTQKAQIDAMKASARNFEFDDSALGQAKQALSEVKERLDVAQKMLSDDLFFEQGMTTAGQPKRDILKEIKVHFSEQAAVAEPNGLVEVDEVNAVIAR